MHIFYKVESEFTLVTWFDLTKNGNDSYMLNPNQITSWDNASYEIMQLVTFKFCRCYFFLGLDTYDQLRKSQALCYSCLLEQILILWLPQYLFKDKK